jgi:hypothetical protein
MFVSFIQQQVKDKGKRHSLVYWIYYSTLKIQAVSSSETLAGFYQATWRHIQSKALPMIVDAPWCVPNAGIRRHLQIPTVKEEIRRYSPQYSARLSAQPNDLIVNLIELPDNRRL